MIRLLSLMPAGLLLVVTLSATEVKPSPQAQVRETEIAFAKTMADRDHAAFISFIAEDAVFLAKTGPLRGRQAVAEGWKPRFTASIAPFSWEPERVEVAESGRLAISTGPVRDPEGKRTGTFVSTWRLEPDGKWRIVLDMGCPSCDCAPQP